MRSRVVRGSAAHLWPTYPHQDRIEMLAVVPRADGGQERLIREAVLLHLPRPPHADQAVVVPMRGRHPVDLDPAVQGRPRRPDDGLDATTVLRAPVLEGPVIAGDD